MQHKINGRQVCTDTCSLFTLIESEICLIIIIIIIINKKVLLRERKRHTDRSVTSTPYAVLSRGGGVTYLGPARGGTYLGEPPILTDLGAYLPWLGGYLPWGTPCSRPGCRGSYLGVGVPPPQCKQTENIVLFLPLLWLNVNAPPPPRSEHTPSLLRRHV